MTGRRKGAESISRPGAGRLPRFALCGMLCAIPMPEKLFHTFAGSPLERADPRCKDGAWLAGRRRDSQSRLILFEKLDPLVIEHSPPALAAFSPDDVDSGLLDESVFLGLEGECAVFALEIDEGARPADSEAQPLSARKLALTGPAGDAAICAHGRAMLHWQETHRYCGRCGAPTEARLCGQWRRCSNADCRAMHFPRVEPVAIMLVYDADQCLLGRSRRFPDGMYSALAGFMEPGETIEEAVRREVMEEAGVRVGDVRYHSSQPWPFHSSLMIGCLAKAEDREIVLHDNELEDARWFDRDAIERALADEHPDLRLPPSIAIAHHLIRAWLSGL